MDVEKTFSFNFTKAWAKASTTPSLGCVVLTLEDRFEINPSGELMISLFFIQK